MPPVLYSTTLTVEEAIARGAEVWEVMLQQWGSPLASGFPSFFPFGGTQALPAPAAIAIGPRSIVDRAWVCYDLQKFTSGAWDYFRRVSVDAPLAFQQPARRQVVANTPPNPLALVFNENDSIVVVACAGGVSTAYVSDTQPFLGTNYDDTAAATYVKADGSVVPFGPVAAFGTPGRFTAPFLHLYWYLRPPIVAPPAKRFQLSAQVSDSIRDNAGAETLIAQIPIHGRKTVVLTVVCDVIADIRAAILPLSLTNIPEGTAFTAAAVAANHSTRAVITDATGDWLMVYAKPAAPNGHYNLLCTALD